MIGLLLVIFQDSQTRDIIPRAYNTIASNCIERDSTSKCTIRHRETMCIPQHNFSKGNQSSASSKATEWLIQCLISFELVFLPSFFNIMTHLLVHLIKEISILGPMFLHNMFSFERFMRVLKKCQGLRNRGGHWFLRWFYSWPQPDWCS
jgi:hypothetical protein